MNDARTAILERVRRAQKTGRIPMNSAGWRQGPPPVTPAQGAALERFVAELKALGVACHIASSAEDVRARVADIVGRRVVFAWDVDRLPYDAGRVLGPDLLTGASNRALQATADIGVTGCHGAIAETGSIAVLSGRGTPRAASLLPPTHLCLVRRTDLYASIGEFFRARSADIAAASCCTLITGPSRTADIELTLTLGVHGPGVVIVIVGP